MSNKKVIRHQTWVFVLKITLFLLKVSENLSGFTTVSYLQRIQNKAARIVTRTKLFDHISPVLRNLHWLPVHHRITFKQLTLAYSALHIEASPQYLKDLLTVYQPSRTLRSSNQSQLSVPSTRTKLAESAFSVAAPKLWNSLPSNIRTAPSIESFKRLLKTYLFNQ